MDRTAPRVRYISRLLPGLFATLLLALATSAQAQPLSHAFVKEGIQLRAAFRPVVAEVRPSVVRVFNDDDVVALGVIVSQDGLILTKKSELRGETSVELPDETRVAATLVSVDTDADLALLHVKATDLKPIEWSIQSATMGSWVASAGPGPLPVGIGIVGVTQQDVPGHRAILGIELGLDKLKNRPLVVGVFPESGADRAGLREGDIILSVAGLKVADRRSLQEKIAEYRPGDTLNLHILRQDKEQEIRATLGSVESTLFDRHGRRNTMTGPLSVRSGGFEDVIQHATFLDPHQCGGPIVNLDGEVVGLNIARAGRVQTFALPTSEILPILEDLLPKPAKTVQVAAPQP